MTAETPTEYSARVAAEAHSLRVRDLLVQVQVKLIERGIYYSRQHDPACPRRPDDMPVSLYDMDIIDVIEMICDAKARGENDKPNVEGWLKYYSDQHRSNFGDQLIAIINNTVKHLKW